MRCICTLFPNKKQKRYGVIGPKLKKVNKPGLKVAPGNVIQVDLKENLTPFKTFFI